MKKANVRSSIIGLLFSALLVFSQHVFAIEVKDLYLAKVAVDSQTTAQRNVALKLALKTVLIKVSGKIEIIEHPAIKQQLNRYNQFVSNYRYQRIQDRQYLMVNFEPQKINQLFIDNNLPIWGSLRPQVVLWLVEEKGFERTILNNSANELYQQVLDVASSRGIPVISPMMDLIDSEYVNTSDVWGRFIGPIQQASMRYQPEAIVIIRVSDNSLLLEQQMNTVQACVVEACLSQVALDWSFISTVNNEQTQTFSNTYSGSDKGRLITDVIDDITNKIVADYALTTAQQGQYLLDVANVDSLAKYVEIKSFLEKLSAVESVTLVTASGDKRRFSLKLFGSEQTLLASLKLNKSLRRYVDPLDPESYKGVPLFYWESS